MNIWSWFKFIVMGSMMVLPGCLYCGPLFHKPSHDPSPLILSLTVPEKVESLSRIPKDRTIVENGVATVAGRQEKRDVKEWFTIGSRPAYAPGVTYDLMVCYSEEDAKKKFEFYKNDDSVPPYFTGGFADRAYFIRYIVQDRRGDTGVPFVCERSDYQSWYAAFRLRNVFIRINVLDSKDNPDALTKPVKYLADLLAKEWGQ
jgi:hypothetical protein